MIFEFGVSMSCTLHNHNNNEDNNSNSNNENNNNYNINNLNKNNKDINNNDIINNDNYISACTLLQAALSHSNFLWSYFKLLCIYTCTRRYVSNLFNIIMFINRDPDSACKTVLLSLLTNIAESL